MSAKFIVILACLMLFFSFSLNFTSAVIDNDEEKWSNEAIVSGKISDEKEPRLLNENIVMWEDNGLWFKDMRTNEVRLLTYYIPTKHNEYETQNFISYDGDFHIVEIVDNEVYYLKMDYYGKVLKKVTLGKYENAKDATIVVKNEVHIAYICEKNGREDVYYALIKNESLSIISLTKELSLKYDGTSIFVDEDKVCISFGSSIGGWYTERSYENFTLKLVYNDKFTAPSICRHNDDFLITWLNKNQELWFMNIKTTEKVLLSKTCFSKPSIGSLDGSVYIFWSDFRDGNSEIYYAKVSDKPNLIRLTFNDESSLNPNLFVDGKKRLNVVWQDRRNGNFDIYLRHTYAYDLELKIESEVIYIHPMELKELQIIIKNTGDLKNKFTIYGNLSSKEFDIFLFPQYIELLKNEEAKIKLIIKAPKKEIEEKAFIFLEINAEKIAKRISIPIFLIIKHEIKLFTNDTVLMTGYGTPTVYNITLKNNGEAKEDVGISVFGIWNYKAPSFLSIEPKESIAFDLEVFPPESVAPNDVVSFFVKAFIIDLPQISDRLVVHAVVAPSFYISLVSEKDYDYVLSGDKTEYNIEIKNHGNVRGKAHIFLEIISGFGDWLAELDKDSLEISGFESADFKLTVRAPNNAIGGERLVTRIEAYDEKKIVRAETTITTYVKCFYSFEANIEEKSIYLDPGDKGIYKIIINNNGNVRNLINLNFSKIPLDWYGEFSLSGKSISEVYVEPRSFVSVTLFIHTSASALAGSYDIYIKLFDFANNYQYIQVKAFIKEFFRVVLYSPKPNQETAGATVVFPLSIKNLGNCNDTIRLSSDEKIEFRDLDFKPKAQVTLAPDETVNINVIVPVTDDEKEITVKAISRCGIFEKIKFFLKAILPDIEILSVSYSKDVRPGEKMNIFVHLRNNGQSPTWNNGIRFMVDNRVIEYERVDRVSARADFFVSFVWLAEEGRHEIAIDADWENNIYESNENNNRVKIAIDIQTEKIRIEPIIVGFGLCAASLIGIAFWGNETFRYKLLVITFVPLYTKIKKEKILDHFLRGEIYGYIKANPGEHYSSIRRALGLTNGTLAYHIRTLEREKFIKSQSDGWLKRFYPFEMKIPQDIEIKLNKAQEIIVNIIRQRPGITQKEIAEQIGLSTATVNYHINALVLSRFVKLKRKGRETHCYIIEEET
ncbi:MAG: winged helix-turn-helix transcriptional regulator [Candidatus Thermoplasmatota archaeon]